VLLGDAGCKMPRIENSRVGGSIPPLATIQIKGAVSSLKRNVFAEVGFVVEGLRHVSRFA
jgi:hypothetical protein